nr:SMI1/KNR4 family protein [Deinococcus aestuarii]
METYFALPFAWNLPATEEELQAAARTLEITWPPEVEVLYRQHNGANGLADDWEEQWAERLNENEDTYPQVPRLMTLPEAEEFHEDSREIMNSEVRFFWTDDNSNYVGVYVFGALAGCVCLFRHDEPDSSPRFRSIHEFLTITTSNPLLDPFHDEEFTTTYPVLRSDKAYVEGDWNKAEACFALVTDHNDGESQLLASAMILTPYERSDALIPYLGSPDFFVAARAARILGARRYAPAKPLLQQLAQNGVSNARSAAQIALRNWDF